MKWKIERTHLNCIEINKYCNTIDRGGGYSSTHGWIYSEKVSSAQFHAHSDSNGKQEAKVHDSFTTITIEEFRAITSGKPIGANYLIYN